MKRRMIAMLGIISVTMGLAACGQAPASRGDSGADGTSSDAVSEKEEESSEEKTAGLSDEDLPNWEGVKDHFGYYVDFSESSVSIDLEYPSLKPTSYGWAYQKDAAHVGVLSPGYDEDWNNIQVDALENTFALSKDYFCEQLDQRRDKRHYDNYDFIVETAEPVTINEISMYKFTGTHTYTYDEEERECYFVAYSIDTKQIEHSFPTIIVIDDTLSNPTKDPVSKEIVEAYARKMAESVKID